MRKAFEFFLGLASGFAFSFFFLYLREEFLWFLSIKKLFGGIDHESKVCQGR